MPNYDSDILIKNIKSHMTEKSITQEKLAKVLGMSQSNISKALNAKDKKSFTLDQVIGIAKFFQISVDSLIGEKDRPTISITPRSIATFLVQMIESNNAKFFDYEISEEIHEIDTMDWPPSHLQQNKKIKYPAIYLPSYWHIPSNLPYDEEQELVSEMYQVGNDTIMKPVNDFLHHFQEIHAIYKTGNLSEDTYRVVLTDMLNHLND